MASSVLLLALVLHGTSVSYYIMFMAFKIKALQKPYTLLSAVSTDLHTLHSPEMPRCLDHLSTQVDHERLKGDLYV